MHYLDIGCGMGEMSLEMARRGCRQVTGIDKDPYYIEIAKRCARERQLEDKVTFRCMDVHEMPDEREYDIVLSHEMLEHVERPAISSAVWTKSSSRIRQEGQDRHGVWPAVPFAVRGPHEPILQNPHTWMGLLFSEAAILRLRREVLATDSGCGRIV